MRELDRADRLGRMTPSCGRLAGRDTVAMTRRERTAAVLGRARDGGCSTRVRAVPAQRALRAAGTAAARRPGRPARRLCADSTSMPRAACSKPACACTGDAGSDDRGAWELELDERPAGQARPASSSSERPRALHRDSRARVVAKRDRPRSRYVDMRYTNGFSVRLERASRRSPSPWQEDATPDA
ncbi:MAG: hypothetical protein MZV65_19920 [Chromatiales bacterium]|nr:hypothetical protein [Chromatiales bacterium]